MPDHKEPLLLHTGKCLQVQWQLKLSPNQQRKISALFREKLAKASLYVHKPVAYNTFAAYFTTHFNCFQCSLVTDLYLWGREEGSASYSSNLLLALRIKKGYAISSLSLLVLHNFETVGFKAKSECTWRTNFLIFCLKVVLGQGLKVTTITLPSPPGKCCNKMKYKI